MTVPLLEASGSKSGPSLGRVRALRNPIATTIYGADSAVASASASTPCAAYIICILDRVTTTPRVDTHAPGAPSSRIYLTSNLHVCARC